MEGADVDGAPAADVFSSMPHTASIWRQGGVRAEAACRVLLRIVANVLEYPSELRFRRVRETGSSFSKVMGCAGAAGVLEQHVPRKRQVWGGAQAPEKNGFLSPIERVHRPARVYGDDDDAARRSPPRPPVTASRCDADADATLPPPPPPPVRDGKTPGQRELLGVT